MKELATIGVAYSEDEVEKYPTSKAATVEYLKNHLRFGKLRCGG